MEETVKRTQADRDAEKAAWYQAQDEKSLLNLIHKQTDDTNKILRNISGMVTVYLVLVLLGMAFACLYVLFLT